MGNVKVNGNDILKALEKFEQDCLDAGDTATITFYSNGTGNIGSIHNGSIFHFASPSEALNWLRGNYSAPVRDEEDLAEMREAGEEDAYGPQWEVDYEVLDQMHR